MHIGILRTASVRPEWVPTYGEYPDMFERLLLAEDDALTFTTWNVEAGELPDGVAAAPPRRTLHRRTARRCSYGERAQGE